jgi:hypothetical protein
VRRQAGDGIGDIRAEAGQRRLHLVARHQAAEMVAPPRLEALAHHHLQPGIDLEELGFPRWLNRLL